jgi:ankyrin repeat protein
MMLSTGETNSRNTSAASAAGITIFVSHTSAAAIEVEESISDEMILACCKEGDITKLRLWTSLGVNVLFSAAPLMKAAECGRVEVLRYLAKELGADVNKATYLGYTALMFAARHRFLEVARCLVKDLSADVNQANDYGDTAFSIAAQCGNVDMLRYLGKELGADVNQANVKGFTALLTAALVGSLDVVHCLIKDLGAHVNQADVNGFTPFGIAAQSGNVAMLRYLGKALGGNIQQESNAALIGAANHNDLDVVKCLVKEFAADVNRATEGEITPLIFAAHTGNLGVAHWLLAEGGARASVSECSSQRGNTLWNMLKLENADDVELTSLLQTMVLHDDAPLEFIARLSPQQAEIWKRGEQLRRQLPAYLEQQRLFIVAHCPLPGVLLPLVAEYAAPTSEDMWTDGLSVSVVERSVGCCGATNMCCTVC